MLMGSSAQKISVRLKPAVVHKGIQTDSTLLAADVSHKSMEKKEKRILENPYLQPIAPSPRPSPLLSRKKAYVKWENKESSQKMKEEHHEHHSYKPSYQELERVCTYWNKYGFTHQYCKECEAVAGWEDVILSLFSSIIARTNHEGHNEFLVTLPPAMLHFK